MDILPPAGEGEETAKTGNIPELLNQIIAQYDRNMPGHTHYEASDSVIPDLNMRPQAMRRALDNLIGNATRYANRAEIRTKIRNDNIFIFIDDDGPGIEPEFRADALRLCPAREFAQSLNRRHRAGPCDCQRYNFGSWRRDDAGR